MSDRRAVIDGKLIYTSPSALQKFDPQGTGGCNRRWWYRYVDRQPEEQSPAQSFGTHVGKELEVYLKGGQRPTVPLAVRALAILPAPGPDIIVEKELPGLTADGLRVVAKPDLVHKRGTNIGGSDIAATLDPPDTVEIIDHKTSKGALYLPDPEDLIGSLQMLAYGEAMRRLEPDATHIRLSHNCMVRSPASVRKVTRLHVVDEFPRRWEYADALVRQMRDVARETDALKVQINRRACDEYSGCSYKKSGLCAGPKFNALINALGDKAMGLIDTLRKKTPTPAELEAQAAAERASRVDPALRAAIEKLEKFGSGMPTLIGRAAMVYAAVKNLTLQGEGYAGSGEFGEQLEAIEDPLTLVQLAGELPDAPAVEAPPSAPSPAPTVHPAAILPPDAPASDPVAAHAALSAKKPGRPKKVVADAPAVEIAAAPPVDTIALGRALATISSGFLAAAIALGYTGDAS